MAVVSASGEFCRKILVVTSVDPQHVMDSIPSEMAHIRPYLYVTQQKAGWVSGEIVQAYFKDCVIPTIEEISRPTQDEPAWIVLDQHSTHESKEFLDLLGTHNIRVLFLPSHCSHILQPLDRVCCPLALFLTHGPGHPHVRQRSLS